MYQVRSVKPCEAVKKEYTNIFLLRVRVSPFGSIYYIVNERDSDVRKDQSTVVKGI